MDIKVMIVDDERLERVLIKKSYDWEGNDFLVVAEASSGDDAMDLVKKHQPDIIFTDINMPFMDGISFCTWVRKYYPMIRVVIITGFRKFEYAQRAVQLGVKEFLLKPIQKEDIHGILNRCKIEIIEEQAHYSELNQLKQSKSKHEKNIFDNLLERLLEGTLDVIKEKDKLVSYQMDDLLRGGICICLKLNHPQLINRIEKNLACKPYCLIYKGNTIIVLPATYSNLEDDLENVKQELKRDLGSDIVMTVGNYCEGVEGVSLSYRQALHLTKPVPCKKGNDIRFYRDYLVTSQSKETVDINTKELIFSLENGLREKAYRLINEYSASLSEMDILELETVRFMSLNIVTIFLTVLDNKNKNLSHAFETEQLFYDKLARIKTLEELNRFFINCSDQIISCLVGSTEKRSNKLIDDAIAYIDEHLCESGLCLNSIASFLHVNESYLSRTFKKEVGVSIIEYITKNRIKKSIVLLTTTDLKVYEVALEVGIEDAHYFGICFKKNTGKTIKQFKESLFNK
ncbi:MAG: response regulator [Turicibacter sp.]